MVRPPGNRSPTASDCRDWYPAAAAAPPEGTSTTWVGRTTSASAAGGITSMVRLVSNRLADRSSDDDSEIEHSVLGLHATATNGPSSPSGLPGTRSRWPASSATSMDPGLLDDSRRPIP